MESPSVWLITGASSGLGQALATYVLEQGQRAIATFRQAAQAEAFTKAHAPNGRGLVVDMSQPATLEAIPSMVQQQFGRLDVLVNNAGVGMVGAIEETPLAAARELWEINFWGPLRLTQLLLPIFRQQRSGRMLQLSSHSGFKAFAGFGMYSASKFALEGASEALAGELLPLGIPVVIIEPGPYRTNFAGGSMRIIPNQLEDYAATAGAFITRMQGISGKQPGLPTIAAQALYELGTMPNPPLRVPLGPIARQTVSGKLAHVAQDLANTEALATQTGL